MQVATTSHVEAQHRRAVSGRMALFLLVVLAGGCLATILAGLAAFDLQPAPAGAWLDTALAWICLGGLAVALSGMLVCCLGSFLDFLARARRAGHALILSLTASCAAPLWRVWTDLRPPRFLS